MATIEQHEAMIRALVAYGDTMDRCAYDLVWGYTIGTLTPVAAAKVRTIIEAAYGQGNISDSLLEDILDGMDSDADDWNE